MIGLEPDRLVEILNGLIENGLIEVAMKGVGGAAPAIRQCIVRVIPQRLAEFRNRRNVFMLVRSATAECRC